MKSGGVTATVLERSGARDVRWLVRSYIRVLALVTLLVCLGQFFMQRELSRQDELLRRIEWLQDRLYTSSMASADAAELDRLEFDLNSLASSLDDDPEAQGLLERTKPQLQVVLSGLRAGTSGEKERQSWELLRHTLDVVGLHLNQAGQRRLRLLRYLEGTTACLILIVLAIEATMIFRPAASQVQDRFMEVESSRQMLGKRLQILHDSHESIKADLKAAAEVQRSLLPREIPVIPGCEFAWSFKASHDVAGDMFNLIRLDETHVGLYVLDVSGHGVPAALLSVSLSRAITANVGSVLKRRFGEAPFYQLVRPSEVAQELNRRFPVMSESDQFFTFLYGILDCEKLTFDFVQAGHPGPLIVSENQVLSFEEAPDPPIGILSNVGFTENRLQLQAGDQLFLYTDGVVEALDRNNEMFGVERMTDCLRRHRASGIESCLENLYEEVRCFTRGHPQKDDITLLGFGLTQAAPAVGPTGPPTARAVTFGASEVTSSGRFRSFGPKPRPSNN